MRKIFRILVAITSGVLAFWAFPSILLFGFLVLSLLGFGSLPETVAGWCAISLPFAVILFPIFVYYSLKRRDEKKIEMPRSHQTVVVLGAGLLTFLVFSPTFIFRVSYWPL